MRKKQESLKNWLPFEKARDYAHSLNLGSGIEWQKWCKSGHKPNNIPSGPSRIYEKQGWESWGDFLGTRRRRKGWLSYNEARKKIVQLGLKSQDDWRNLVKKGHLPHNIPTNPQLTYKNS